jgi:hypothetical protein
LVKYLQAKSFKVESLAGKGLEAKGPWVQVFEAKDLEGKRLEVQSPWVKDDETKHHEVKKSCSKRS